MATQPEPPPHAAVRHVHRPAVHQRAPADDARHAASLALANRFVGDAALPEGSVKPHVAHAVIAALFHDVRRNTRVGSDNHAIDRPLDGAEIRITPNAVEWRLTAGPRPRRRVMLTR